MDAIHNFRDFGGYKTVTGSELKKGLLYRSGDLSGATDTDLANLAALGIKTIYDLRSDRERQRQPDRIPGSASFTSFHLPMRPVVEYHGRSLRRLFSLMFGRERRTDYVAETYQAYREYATGYLPQLKAMFRRLSRPENLPALIHCSAGKDRTGVVIGLFQLALGVPRRMVMDDYLKSNDYLDNYKEEIFRRLSKLSYVGVPWKKLYAPLFAARADFMTAALEQARVEFGAVDAWLRRGLGFSERDQRTLVKVFCEASS